MSPGNPWLPLAAVGALAALGAVASRRGSRAAHPASDELGVVVGESDVGAPVVILLRLNALSEITSIEEIVGIPLLGVVELRYPSDSGGRRTSGCEDREGRGPYQVFGSAAESGWGPLTYDATLWVVERESEHNEDLSGFILPDRTLVSEDAYGVWKYYREHRKQDVISRALPRTCPRYEDDAQDPVLDRMYRAKPNARAFEAMAGLTRRGHRAALALAEWLGEDDDAVRQELVKAARRFTSERL